MTIPTEIKDVLLAQHRADVIRQAQEALAGSTKVLSNDVIGALLHYATKTSFASDDTMPARVAQFHYKMPKLHERVDKQWNLIHQLQRQLADIRTYLGVGTDEELSAAVAAGRRYAAIPKTDGDKIIEQAKERAEQARAKAEAEKAAKK